MVLCVVPESKGSEKAADHPFSKERPQGSATSFIPIPVFSQAAQLSQAFHHGQQWQ